MEIMRRVVSLLRLLFAEAVAVDKSEIALVSSSKLAGLNDGVWINAVMWKRC